MEIILAIVVASAVIIFGALISIGNERQRKAIDGLREQVVMWAMQDIRIKREHIARDVDVPDPLGWLNQVASKVCGRDLKLQILEVFDSPGALLCSSGDGSMKAAFSPFSPADIRKMKHGRNRLNQFSDHNPLLSLPRVVGVNELSILNEELLFDLKVSIVWKKLTGQSLVSINRFWMYVYS